MSWAVIVKQAGLAAVSESHSTPILMINSPLIKTLIAPLRGRRLVENLPTIKVPILTRGMLKAFTGLADFGTFTGLRILGELYYILFIANGHGMQGVGSGA